MEIAKETGTGLLNTSEDTRESWYIDASYDVEG